MQAANAGVNVGVMSNINYFISKNGNPCIRYDVQVASEEKMEGRIKVFPPLAVEGSFVFFLMPDNPVFLDIIEVH